MTGTKKAKGTTTSLEPIDPVTGSPAQNKKKDKMLATTNKKELVDAVRTLNPAGLNSAPGIFWDVEGGLKTTTMDDSGVKQQVAIVENGVVYSIKRYNDLRVTSDRLSTTLKAKLDELEDQKKNFETLDAMKNATTEEGLRIKSLQKEAKDLKKEIENKEHYTRQLEHMLLRLKQNALKFDAHMTGMEETEKNIRKEGAEIRLLRRDLDAGLAKAVKVLEETKTSLQTSRKDREVLLAQRRNELKTAQTLQIWMGDREAQKQALAVELKGDLTRDEEMFLRGQLGNQVEKTKDLQRATEESHKRLQAMEDAFLQLKQVTGVSSLDAMYEKFNNQKNSKKALEIDVKDAEARLAKAKKFAAKQEHMFHDLKASGGGMAELSREATDNLESSIAAKKAEQKLVGADTDRLNGLLLGLQQGSAGLLQRVHPHLHLSDGNVFELTESDEKQPWVVAMDGLSTAEQILAKMMEALAGDGTGSPTNLKGIGEDDEEIDNSDTHSIGTAAEAPMPAKNVRIKSLKIKRDEEAREGMVATTAVGATAGKPFMTGGDVEDTPEEEETPVATRNAVKHVSAHRTNAHNKKVEMAIRKQLLKETMASVGTSDAALEQKAKLIQQTQCALRLSTFPAPVTLPEGITLRDDPMTKTKAFLEKMPKLV
eukprot:GSChrysophyteH2.ASY1.ANO1.235.1 assembled CDS